MAIDNWFTGGGLQPQTTATPMPKLPGPGTPPTPVGGPMAMPDYSALGTGRSNADNPFAGRDYNELVGQSLDYFMNPGSEYMQNARQRGLELAATRGGINSSIAAGASERAALEAATPLAQGAVAAQLGQEQSQLNNWIDQQGFNREMASLPYKSSVSMLNAVSQMAIQDPQLYTPSVVSGFSNFFNQNMNDILGRYFGGQ